jgi:hypothetical protein
MRDCSATEMRRPLPPASIPDPNCCTAHASHQVGNPTVKTNPPRCHYGIGAVYRRQRLEHRAEKWVAVFGKKDPATRSYGIEPDSEIRFDAVEQSEFMAERQSALTL